MIKRFQNRLSESRFLLATVGLLTIAVWIASGALGTSGIIPFVLTSFCIYLMAELDTRNSLLRTYSRMIPSLFLIFTTMTGLFLDIDFVLTTAVWCMITFHLFSTYQNRNSAFNVFVAFLCLGLNSMIFGKIIFFAPLLWLVMYANLRSMGMRTFLASVIGFLMPYWFAEGYLLFNGTPEVIGSFFEDILVFDEIDYLSICMRDATTLGILALLSLTGIIHFVRNSSQDKIRTRMLYESVIVANVFAFITIALQPSAIQSVFPVIVITSSILISHFIVLTHTKITNIYVCLILLLIIAATISNLWMQ